VGFHSDRTVFKHSKPGSQFRKRRFYVVLYHSFHAFI